MSKDKVSLFSATVQSKICILCQVSNSRTRKQLTVLMDKAGAIARHTLAVIAKDFINRSH